MADFPIDHIDAAKKPKRRNVWVHYFDPQGAMVYYNRYASKAAAVKAMTKDLVETHKKAAYAIVIDCDNHLSTKFVKEGRKVRQVEETSSKGKQSSKGATQPFSHERKFTELPRLPEVLFRRVSLQDVEAVIVEGHVTGLLVQYLPEPSIPSDSHARSMTESQWGYLPFGTDAFGNVIVGNHQDAQQHAEYMAPLLKNLLKNLKGS